MAHLFILLLVATVFFTAAFKQVRLPRGPGRMRMMSSAVDSLETAKFLDATSASAIREACGTPCYVYSEKILREQADKALKFPNPYGMTVRFAMKACPNAAILQLFNNMGINFDASSGYEVIRAVKAGIKPNQLSLSSQELPHNFKELIEMGTEFNACSLNQLETFGKLFPGGSCGVRFNPGTGSGGTGKTVIASYAFVHVCLYASVLYELI
jgi:diaminopimelate decarboxylase